MRPQCSLSRNVRDRVDIALDGRARLDASLERRAGRIRQRNVDLAPIDLRNEFETDDAERDQQQRKRQRNKGNDDDERPVFQRPFERTRNYQPRSDSNPAANESMIRHGRHVESSDQRPASDGVTVNETNNDVRVATVTTRPDSRKNNPTEPARTDRQENDDVDRA